MTQVPDLYGKPWTRREYLIVLDAYFHHQGEPRHLGAPYVEKLAQIIARTAASVVMRLENFASLDSECESRVGLTHINSLGRRLFKEYSCKKDALRELANFLILENKERSEPNLFEPNPIQLPRAFQKYELYNELGEGGCGSVFSCVDPTSNQWYALKIIRTDRVYDPEVLARFRREIRVLNSVSHRNVIKLHMDNLESQRDFPAYVMDLAERSLADALGENGGCRGKLARADAYAIITSLMDGLEALHNNTPKIIHRDINPNNVLQLADGTWVLADFGLAKFLSTMAVSTGFQTRSQRGLGTAWYTAPEQYRNFLETDERTDIYSLGILIWEVFSSSPPPPAKEDLGLPATLADVFHKATERNRDQRYRCINEMRVDFHRAYAQAFSADNS